MLDQLIANAWPPATAQQHGSWTFRYSSGVTRRANSAFTAGGEDRIDEFIAAGEDYYASRGAPALFHVSEASSAPSLAPRLTGLGYVEEAVTLVMVADTETVQSGDVGTWSHHVTDSPEPDWFAIYWETQQARSRSDADATTLRDVLLRPALPARYVAAGDALGFASVGQIVCEDGWAGVQCTATRWLVFFASVEFSRSGR